MNNKDISQKSLEDYNDVFADIADVLLYNGQGIIKANELINTKDKSQFKADDSTLHEQERDVSKLWLKSNICIAMCGVENQTTIDKDMPLRIIGYDGVSYKSQILNKNSKDRYPVITIVLYFGKKHWTKPLSLYDCIDVPEELKPYVNDYKINLFEVAYLPDDTIRKFKSDFGIIADFFSQKRKYGDYTPSSQKIVHTDEFLKLMGAVTGDNAYIIAMEKGGTDNMCDFAQKCIERGRSEGRMEGQILAYHMMGISIDEICDKLCVTKEQVISVITNI